MSPQPGLVNLRDGFSNTDPNSLPSMGWTPALTPILLHIWVSHCTSKWHSKRETTSPNLPQVQTRGPYLRLSPSGGAAQSRDLWSETNVCHTFQNALLSQCRLIPRNPGWKGAAVASVSLTTGELP